MFDHSRSIAEELLAERIRQQSAENWTPEHDDGHTDGSLGLAAACYAAPVDIGTDIDWPIGASGRPTMLHGGGRLNSAWPWAEPRKHRSRRDELVKAGALILAEIERLDRIGVPAAPTQTAREGGE